MKAASIALVVLATFLGGCAASGASTRRESSATYLGLDQVKMAKIEAAARARGVDVVWINPPEAPPQAP